MTPNRQRKSVTGKPKAGKTKPKADLTQKNSGRAGETPRENEGKLRLILDTMSEGLALNEIVYDENGEMCDYRILEVNKAFYKMVDITGGEAIGRLATSLYSMTSEFIRDFWRAHKGKSEVQHTEYFNPLHNRYFQVSTSPFVGDTFVTSFFDITERKQAELALQIAEQDYRSIFQNAPVGIFQSSPDGRFLKVNSTMAKIYGYESPEEMVDTVSSISKQIHFDPFTREEFKNQLEENGEIFDFENRNLRKDGSIIWTSTNARTVMNDTGQIIHYEGFVRDITEHKQVEEARRESQARLASVIDSAMDAIISIDADQRIILFNPAAERIFRCPATEALGQPLDRFMPERFRETHRKHVGIFEKTNQTNRLMGNPLPLSCLRADGEEFPAEITISQVETAGWEIYIAILRDVTESHRMLEALRLAEEKYRGIFENAVEAITQTSPEGRYITANPAAARMLGFETQEELIAAAPNLETQFYVEPGRRREFVRLMEENESISDFESEVYCKDGSRIWISETSRAIRDEKGGLLYYEGTAVDITERKRSEEALKSRADELNALQSTVLELTAPHELPTLLHTIVARAVQLLNADSGGLYLCDPARQEALCVVSYNTPRDYTGVTLKYGEGAAGLVAQTGEPLIVNDYRAWSGRAAVYDEEKPFERLVSAPMKWQGVVSGVIHGLRSAGSSPFAQADLELLSLLANHAAIAVANAQQMESLQVELTERKQVEEALRLAEENYRNLVEQMPAVVYRDHVDESASSLYISPQVESLLGYPPSVYAENPTIWHQQIFREDYERAVATIKNTLDTGRAVEEYRVITKDGRVLWLRDTSALIRDENGTPKYIQGFLEDVTARRQAEDSLRASEDFRRLIVDTEPECVKLVAPDGGLLEMNPAGLAMIEADSLEEVRGTSMIRIIAPKYRDAFNDLHKRVMRGESGMLEFEIIGLKGTRRWLETHAVPLRNASNQIEALLGVTRDITARKQAEEALSKEGMFRKSVIERAGEGLCVCHAVPEFPYVHFTIWNERMMQLTGYTMEEINEKGWYQSLYPDLEYQRKAIARMDQMRDGRDLFAEEWEITRADGRKRIFAISTTLLLAEEGAAQVLALMTDITEHKQAEEKLQKQNLRLKALREIDSAILAADSIESIVGTALKHIHELIECQRAVLSLLDWETNETVVFNVRTVNETFIGQGTRMPLELFQDITQTLSKNEPVLINDLCALTDPPPLFQNLIKEGLRSVCILPLFSQNNLIGAFNISSEIPGFLDEEKISLGREVANQVAIAITQNDLVEALRESEQKYRTLVEQLPVVVYSNPANDVTSTTYVSPQIETFLGYTQEEWLADPKFWSKALHPDDLPRVTKEVEHMDKTGELFDTEYRMVARDDRIVWIRDQAALLRDPDGRPLLWQGLMSNITERKLAEEALRAGEERYRTLVTGMLDGVYRSTHEGKFVDVNPAMVKMFGYDSPGEMLALDIKKDLYFAPEERESLFLDTGQEKVDEFRMKRKDGSEIWVEDHGRYIHDAQGNVLYHEGILRDITERKRAEEELRTNEVLLRSAVEAAPIILFTLDIYGIFQLSTGAGLKSLGLKPGEVVGLSHFEIYKELELANESVQRALKGENVYFVIEAFGVIWDVRYAPLYGANNEITGMIGTAVDVTERKRAEEALRQSEAFTKSIVENEPECVKIIGPGGELRYMNPAGLAMIEVENLASVAGKSVYPMVVPEDREAFIELTERVLKGESGTLQFEMVGIKSTRRWMDTHAVPLYDGQGKVSALLGITRDITERKRAENALRQAEAKYRSLVERLPVVVYTSELGVEGRWYYVSPQIERLLGFTPEEWMADPGLWYRQIHPEDRDRQKELEKQAWARGESFDNEYRIYTRDGSIIWIRDTALILPPQDGGAPIVQGTLVDVTERKQAEDAVYAAEEKYRSIFENAVEGIYQSAPDGRFHTINPAFAVMLGYDSPQEMITSVTDIAAQIYHDPSRRTEFISLLEEQGQLSGFEYQLRRKDGETVWVSENARAVRDLEGRTLYYEGLVEDITARKRNEQRIQTQLQQLNALHVIENAINSSSDLRTTLEVILREVVSQLKVDAACVLLFNKETHTLDYTAGRGFLSKATQHTKLGMGEGYAGRIILNRKIIHVPDLVKAENNSLSDALNLAGENFAAYVGSPLIAKGQAVGVLEIFQRAPLTPDADWFDFLSTIADQAALAIDNAQLFENLQRSNFDLTLAYDATIEGWSRALDLRDRETEGHTRRVTNLTIKLARQMGIPDTDILHIRRGALLHDIGKMGIPDSILHKADKLNEKEWENMHQHTKYAYQMLAPITYLRPALDIPRFHHEKWDGTGYPDGLKGEQIPIAARIFAVVDVWDALISKRSYREAWTKEDAIAYIRSEAGRHFDPRVAEVFLSLIASE